MRCLARTAPPPDVNAGTCRIGCGSGASRADLPTGGVRVHLLPVNGAELLSSDVTTRELRRSLLGRRYVLPAPVTSALERVFGEPVGGIIVIERSRYARAHLGMCATTRPNRIFLAMDGREFVGNANLVLHEYFHVVRQWKIGRLTRWRYLAESIRCGYWDNHFEREARTFATETVEQYSRYLGDIGS